jgi:four helix bundle protein
VGFDHERLLVCERAVALAGAIEDLLRTVPETHASLAGQLRRAASSIVLNIAEGASEFSRKEKLRFYRFARRSTAEVRAGLDVLAAGRVLEPAALRVGVEASAEVSRLLHGLVRASPPSSPSPSR